MRRGGLILMGALLPAAGIGLGWLAAEWSFGDATAAVEPDMAIAMTDAPAADQASSETKAPSAQPEAMRLRVALDQAGALEGEVARLRWALADQRRDCQPAAASPAIEETPPVLARAEPDEQIDSVEPEQPEPVVSTAPPAPAFLPERETAPAPPVQVASAEPIETDGPPATPPQQPAVVEPPVAPGQALRVPESAIQNRDLGFLDGCWVSSPFANPVNGMSSTKVYCFDANGNGQMNFRGADGITCTAPIRARWETGRRLVLEEPQDGSCSNYTPWYREATTCSIGGDGRAQCNSYEFFRRFNYGTLLTRS